MYHSELTIRHGERSVTLTALQHDGIHYLIANNSDPLVGPWHIPILGSWSQYKANLHVVACQLVDHLAGLESEAEYNEMVEMLVSDMRSISRQYIRDVIKSRPFD